MAKQRDTVEQIISKLRQAEVVSLAPVKLGTILFTALSRNS